ncbi:M50 family metallopeptidase [Blastococcus sp. Marseille-P5729]|uniref:M50 family metallopeptidase n=1 Tax=Blastococcus sp. Marseille-P5729 TaxID=2086582 RepID=UPI00131BDEC9|nr:M50 family metallopeptidase [Blastococcus sp. Marseille-P5729]
MRSIALDQLTGFVDERFFAAGDLTRLALAVTVAAAAFAVGADPVWRHLRYLVTTVHELGHVVVGWFVGRRVQSVRLHHDTSGLTVTSGRATGPGIFFLYVAGYPAPAVAGFFILWAVIYRRAGWAMAVLLVLLLVALLLVRNVFGAVIILAQIAAFGGVWVWNEPRVLAAVLTLAGSVLALGGLRACLDLVGTQRRRGSKTSDAAILGRQTRLGAAFWAYAFLALSLLLVGVTGLMLYAQSATLS